MTKFADLHIHTYYSDSTQSPQEVVEEALKQGLSCISITDHDTLEGIRPTQLAAPASLEVIPGIELSSEIDKKDVHILGYLFDDTHEAFQEEINRMQEARRERIKKMVKKLKSLGVDNIDPQEVFDLTRSKSVGRPHLATILKEKGWVSSIPQAFDKYLNEDALAYVAKFKITPVEAIRLIRKAKGIAVLAHPMVTNKDELIPHFVEAGLQGIEVYYPNYSKTTIRHYEGMAEKYQLIKTGGSDAHGQIKQNTHVGKIRIPYALVDQLKKEKSSYD